MKVQKPRKGYPEPSHLVEGLKQLKVGPHDIFILRPGPDQDPKHVSTLAYDIAAVTQKYVIILTEGEELINISLQELGRLILGEE